MKFFISLFLLSIPSLIFASALSKQEACKYPDGIHWDPLYIYWPGELPRVDGFLKKDGFLYYFIHIFPSGSSLERYVINGNNPYTPKYGFVRNKAAYFVSFHCSRSKVRFSPILRSFRWDQYGKLLWTEWKYVGYSITRENQKSSCKFADDTILDISTHTRKDIEKHPLYPHAWQGECITRTPFRYSKWWFVEFTLERRILKTQESYYTRYRYNLEEQSLEKLQ